MVHPSDCIDPPQGASRQRTKHPHALTEHRYAPGIGSELELEDFLVSYHELVGRAARRAKPRRSRRS
jgi:hypothetical protein